MKGRESEYIQLSIVVAAWNGNSSLRACLESLKKQSDRKATEIIVAANFPVESADNKIPPSAKIFNLPRTAIVPELRREGIAAARGEIIALVEDHCLFDAHWVEEIKKAHEFASVVGGAVENASVERALDWAVYFYDYGKYMPPNRAGAAESLSGMNVSYKRTLLEEIRETYCDGFYETFVNEELKKRGHQLAMTPPAVVCHYKNYETRQAARHSYHLARAFAARRVAGANFTKRGSFAAATLILPVLLPARVFFSTLRKGRYLKELIVASPFLIFLMLIWSYGEFCGYLIGAGKSAGEWR